MTRPNILFLMTDQQHGDYTGFAENSRIDTPALNRIAEGTVFRNAISPNPVCTPTRVALLTGKYPKQSNMMTMSGDLNPDYPTYFKALKKSGYYTSAVGKMHWLQGFHWYTPRNGGYNAVNMKETYYRYGLDYIWEACGKQLIPQTYCDYSAHLDKKGLLQNYQDEVYRRMETFPGHAPEEPACCETFGIGEEDHVDVVVADKIIKQLTTRPPDKPFCIFGSFLSPHPIIEPPRRYYDAEPEREDEIFLESDVSDRPKLTAPERKTLQNYRRGYRALIRLVDDQIGRVLDTLEEIGEYDNTLIIFTSDHGDLLGDFGHMGKGVHWRGSVNVPLAIRHPQHVDGRRIDAPVSHIDITATMLDAAGLDPRGELRLYWPAWNHDVPCRSLMPVIRGGQQKVRDYTYTESDQWEMIVTEKFKYVRFRITTPEYTPPKELLYDLESDPDELNDVINDPAYGDSVKWARERRDFESNVRLPGQMSLFPIRSDRNRLISDYDIMMTNTRYVGGPVTGPADASTHMGAEE